MPSPASKKEIQDTGWAGHEFAHAKMKDTRLTKRLQRIAEDFADHPGASIPQACGSWGQAKAAYRFFDNDTVEPEHILASHTRATLERMRDLPLVLCARNTTAALPIPSNTSGICWARNRWPRA